jgi:hypothetical protein
LPLRNASWNGRAFGDNHAGLVPFKRYEQFHVRMIQKCSYGSLKKTLMVA